MAKVPSLINLCIDAVKTQILQGIDKNILEDVYELPTEVFDCLLKRLPALALQNLQLQMPLEKWSDHEYDYVLSGNGRKRTRYEKFNMAWMVLYQSRWPELYEQFQVANLSAKNDMVECESMDDWQQKYWETHLQNCFDSAAEIAMLPSFDGCVGEIQLPEALLKVIGCGGQMNCSAHQYLRLCGHCWQFGHYVRSLRLQNVFCTAKTCHLLRNSKLQGLTFRRVSTKEQVGGLCRILSQNSETITSLEFVNCKLSSSFIDAICDSLFLKGKQSHGVKQFTIQASKFADANMNSLPDKFVSFLSSGRSLSSLSLCDNHLQRSFAKLALKTLLDASSNLSSLDLSENDISGWLSDFLHKSSNQPQFSLEISKSLQSLRVLNLRGNNLHKNDVEDLKFALVHMPVLETLDLSDNPIEDGGIRSLIPYFAQTGEHYFLANLKLKNCMLSCDGVTELLEVLTKLKYTLTSLSIADNHLGSQIASALGKFLGGPIKSLDIRDVGLGSSGFLELQRCLGELANLVSINISENRGGIQTAEFLAKLIAQAPDLISVNAGYNLMPLESIGIICSALRVARGKFQHLDLMGNQKLGQLDHTSVFAEFQHNGKPIVLIPTFPAVDVPCDDDP
ncbi:hypothetical protein Ancab_022023 [Ancistrocladus abbreviatus]